MAKIKAPLSLSSAFGIPADSLDRAGVLNVMLDTDTRLFIDPLLLPHSRHSEISSGATNTYEQHFKTIIKLLSKSKYKGDVAWKAAKKLFSFSEISNTCLGYGTSVKGSGFGEELVSSTMETAHQIVSMSIDDVDLFMVLALFEEGIGPDRISDMTTNIILEDLIVFTQRISKELNIPTEKVKIRNNEENLPVNPSNSEGIIFIPSDIVRELPVASDWSDIGRASRENEELRERLNNQVGGIWATMTRAEKRAAKDAALRSKDAFESLIELIHKVELKPYDCIADKSGEMFWQRLFNSIAASYPFDLTSYSKRALSLNEVDNIVGDILAQFQNLVEDKGLWKELWASEHEHRNEKAAQRLLFAVAYSYCKANNLDISPEADSGNGPVDFKVSQGFIGRVVVEVKLSSNPNVKHGYEKQLEIYKKGDDTDRGYFVLIDVGKMGRKYADIQAIRRDKLDANEAASKIVMIDGNQRESASKRK